MEHQHYPKHSQGNFTIAATNNNHMHKLRKAFKHYLNISLLITLHLTLYQAASLGNGGNYKRLANKSIDSLETYSLKYHTTKPNREKMLKTPNPPVDHLLQPTTPRYFNSAQGSHFELFRLRTMAQWSFPNPDVGGLIPVEVYLSKTLQELRRSLKNSPHAASFL